MSSSILRIHHIGIVVEDIEEKSAIFIEKFGYIPESKIMHEVAQKVYVQFLAFGGYRIELITPAEEISPVQRFLERGGGLHHICYESEDIKGSIAYLRKQYGAICISLKTSVSIRDCVVAFLARPDGEVIELVQLSNGNKYFD